VGIGQPRSPPPGRRCRSQQVGFTQKLGLRLPRCREKIAFVWLAIGISLVRGVLPSGAERFGESPRWGVWSEPGYLGVAGLWSIA